MRIIEKILSEDWQKFWCNPNKGLTTFCLYYNKEYDGNKCPKTCYYANKKDKKI